MIILSNNYDLLWSDETPENGVLSFLGFEIGGISINPYICMIKVARKPSADPVQEKLRQAKVTWNKEVSSFINDLIHLKKTMNGWPSKFYQERSKITEPIPADAPTIIGSLAGDFQELAQRGNAIIQQQVEYSKARRKKQPKAPMGTPPQATPTTPAAPEAPEAPKPDLTQQLTAYNASDRLVKLASSFEGKYDLTAEASNPLTRFFSRLTNLPIGFGQAAEMRRLRMSMLSSCVKVFKNLEKLQVQIVRSSADSIDDAWTVFNDDVWKNWNMVRRTYDAYKGFLPKGVPDTGGPIKTPAELEKDRLNEDKKSQELEKKMDRIDQAEQAGKPDPEDATYETPPGEEAPPPSWDTAAQGIIDNSSKAMQLTYANRAKADFLTYFKKLPLTPGSYVVADAMNELLPQSATPEGFRAAAPQFIRTHQQLVYDLNRMFQTSGKSIQEVYQELEAKRAAEMTMLDAKIKQDKEIKKQLQNKPSMIAPEENKAVDQLEATAQAFLRKWVGKTRHQMSMFDNTSAPRLEVYKIAKEARKTIDMVMNHLEKDLKAEKMDPLVKTMNLQLDGIRGLMVNLHQLRTVEKKKHKAAK